MNVVLKYAQNNVHKKQDVKCKANRWQSTDKRMIRKINTLIKDISRHPHKGLGKPEMLKHDLAGLWSRNIGWFTRQGRMI